MMPLITEREIRSLGNQELLFKSYSTRKLEIRLEQLKHEQYDIFLSHAFLDKEIILGLRKYLIQQGFSVYIDWIDDEQLSREDVTKKTANQLKYKMNKSKCLLYAVTEHHINSKWMQWELGYFDGKKGKVAVFPLAKNNNDTTYIGIEYVGLYPYIKEVAILQVYDDEGKNAPLSEWINGRDLTK